MFIGILFATMVNKLHSALRDKRVKSYRMFKDQVLAMKLQPARVKQTNPRWFVVPIYSLVITPDEKSELFIQN